MARIIDGTEMNLIGATVRKYRKQRKMSQQALSGKLELMGVYVCRGSVSRIEDLSRTVTDIEDMPSRRFCRSRWRSCLRVQKKNSSKHCTPVGDTL